MAQQVFKNYNQNQMMLLPPSLDELIPEGHVVRFINKAVRRIDTTDLADSYRGWPPCLSPGDVVESFGICLY
ncbi:MAG: hypothetical protein U5L09_05755 [Bacteroidales bacterium]|nr:hypothetical protein [Bacteroidales bacterium]